MRHRKWTREEYLKKLEELQTEIDASVKGKYRRQKGGQYERDIAKLFKEKFGITLSRTPMSGGFQKNKSGEDFRGDITNLDKSIDFKLSIECKNQKAWSLPAWIRQAEEDAPEGKYPVVISHRHRVVKEGKVETKAEDFITLKLSDFLEIVEQSKIIKRRGR